MEKRLILDFKGLHLIGIECGGCKTQTLVDISNEEAKVPVQCTSCGQFFHAGVVNGETPFQKLAKALKAAKSSDHKITAHIAGVPFEL
jgi:ribosomal protein S27E